MSALRLCLMAALAAMLSGCLEVDQFPRWYKGQYAGKRDHLPHQVLFHNDRLAWSARVQDRTLRQNEYLRAKP